MLPITTQTLRACNVPRTEGKTFYVHSVQQHTFTTTKSPTGKLFPAFLRFAAAPSGDRRSLSTSTHKANNVVSGSTFAQYRSVKHYEAVDVRTFMIQDVSQSWRKDKHKLRNGKDKNGENFGESEKVCTFAPELRRKAGCHVALRCLLTYHFAHFTCHFHKKWFSIAYE